VHKSKSITATLTLPKLDRSRFKGVTFQLPHAQDGINWQTSELNYSTTQLAHKNPKTATMKPPKTAAPTLKEPQVPEAALASMGVEVGLGEIGPAVEVRLGDGVGGGGGGFGLLGRTHVHVVVGQTSVLV